MKIVSIKDFELYLKLSLLIILVWILKNCLEQQEKRFVQLKIKMHIPRTYNAILV